MSNLDLTNYRTTINEIKIEQNLNNSKCSSDCYLKYDYPSSSSTFRACVNNESNEIMIPNITVTNQTFCEASTNPPVLFGNTQYWFDKMFITNTNDYLFNYTNVTGQGSADISMCSCMLLHKDKYSKNYLLVYIPIKLNKNESDSIGEIIDNIVTDVSSETSCTQTGCALGSLLSTKTQSILNLNAFIKAQDFYWIKIKNINFVIYQAVNSAFISNSTMGKIDKYLSSTIKTPRTRTTNLSDFGKIFKSTSLPMNSLTAAEDEIYINCQPTDEEGELLDTGVSKVPLTDSGSPLDSLKKLKPKDFFKNNTFLAIIIGIILMIVLIKGAEYLFKSGTRLFLENL